jgi:hypothetical protein
MPYQFGRNTKYFCNITDFIVIAAQRLTSHATKFVLNLTDNILSYSSVVYHLKQSYPGEIRTIKCKKPEDFLTLAIFDSSFE